MGILQLLSNDFVAPLRCTTAGLTTSIRAVYNIYLFIAGLRCGRSVRLVGTRAFWFRSVCSVMQKVHVASADRPINRVCSQGSLLRAVYAL